MFHIKKRYYEEVTLSGDPEKVDKSKGKLVDKGFSIQDDLSGMTWRKVILTKEVPKDRIVKKPNPDDYIMDRREDDEGYCFCPTEKALKKFAKGGGWDDIEDLEKDTGLPREDFIGKWFLIIGSKEGTRVWIK